MHSFQRFAKQCLADVRFWILLFILIRLYGITYPPLETGHNWRQAIVNMVARNFHEGSANILFPRVDMAGPHPGIAGMEFPLLNYLIHLIASAFGWEHWYGRAINVLVSSFGFLCFHRILEKLYDRRIALYATLVLLASIWFPYSRKVMPDVFACSLVLISCYYGLRFLEARSSAWNLLAFGGIGSLGVLAKIPAAFILLLFLPLLFDRKYVYSRRVRVAGTAVLMSLPVLFWYFHWVPYLDRTYGEWGFPMSRDLVQGTQEIMANGGMVLKRFFFSAAKFIAFFCFLGGFVLAIIRRERRFLIPLAIGLPAFLLFVLKAGIQFPKHDYYVLPFVPLMALMVAYLLDRIPIRWVASLLISGILVEGVANQLHSFRLDEDHRELIELEADLDEASADGLTLVNSGRNPTPLYFAHRKGWLVENEDIDESEELREYVRKGAEYLIVLRKSFTEPMEPPFGEVLLEKPAYRVYRLEKE